MAINHSGGKTQVQRFKALRFSTQNNATLSFTCASLITVGPGWQILQGRLRLPCF